MLGERMRRLRQTNNISQSTVAKYVGVSAGAVSKWENGTASPSRESLIKLAELFRVSIDELIGESVDTALSKIGAIRYDKQHRIPVLGNVSAGTPMYAEENIEGYILANFPDMNSEKYFGLRIRGDSMNAAGLNSGDIVVIRQQSSVDDGQIAVVLVDGDDATIKKYSRQGNMVILSPQSLNPSHHVQVYDISKTQIKILGLAVEARRAL